MNEWLIIGSISAGVGIVAFVVIQLIARQRARAEARALEALSNPEIDLRSHDELTFGPLTQPLAERMPVSESDQEQMVQLLRQAGYYSRTALIEYAAVRFALVIFPLVITCLLALLVPKNLMVSVLIGGGIVTGLLYSIPRVVVAFRARARIRQIERGLPVFVDLLSLGLLGGQTIHSAMQRVTQELSRSYPALAHELEIVRVQASLNTLSHALEQWAERVDITEVHNLVVILTQAERQGVDITDALFEYATNFRVNLRQRADAQANRASVWLVFPTILCLWFPAAIILLGPVFHEIRIKSDEARELQTEIQEQATIPNASTNTNQVPTPPVPSR